MIRQTLARARDNGEKHALVDPTPKACSVVGRMSRRVCRAYRDVGIMDSREFGKRSIAGRQRLRLEEGYFKFREDVLAAHARHGQGGAEEREIGLLIAEIEFQPSEQIVIFTQHASSLALLPAPITPG
jgi:hypothetical protein